MISRGFHSDASLLRGPGYTGCLDWGAVRSPCLQTVLSVHPSAPWRLSCSEDKDGASEDGVSCLLWCLVFREQGSTSSVWIHKKPLSANCGVLQSVCVSIETQCYVKDLQLCSDRSDIQSSWLGTFISIHRQNFSVICEMWMASDNGSAPFVALSWALLKCHSLPTIPQLHNPGLRSHHHSHFLHY